MWFFRAGALQDKAFPTNQLAATNKEDLDIGLVFITSQGNNILLTSDCSRNPLPFNNPVYSLDLVSEQSSLLKIQSFSRLIHLALKLLNDYFLLAFKEKDYLLYYLSVFLLACHTDTGGETMVDVIVKARSGIGASDNSRAGTKGEDSFYHL
jgi:hypothetical protein